MKKLALPARIILGLIFFIFGLNGFLHFLPTPPMSGPAGDFGMALFKTGYMFPVIKAVETVCGLLLLLGMYVPLALVLLAPIIVNIFLFHAFLAPEGLLLPIVIVALEIFLAMQHKAVFKPIVCTPVLKTSSAVFLTLFVRRSNRRSREAAQS